MIFNKKNAETHEASATTKEKFAAIGHKVEKFVDRNPLTVTLIACGTVHVAGYTLLHYVTKPPKHTAEEAEA